MRRIKSNDPNAPDLIAKSLQHGHLVVLPTDTLYGFSGCLSSREAHARVAEVKGHDAKKRLIYLASSPGMVERYVGGWGCVSRKDMEDRWPSPLTVVLRAGENCPVWIGETVAFRVPNVPLIRQVIDRVGEPIFSTSVNQAGKPPLDTPVDIEAAFAMDIDLFVERAWRYRRSASTLVNLTRDVPAVLRQGDYAWTTGEKPSK